MSNASRLRWRCRRGMLELDLLLRAFLDNGYEQLDSAGRRLFEQEVLMLPDQELLEYLLGNKRHNDKEVDRVIQSVRAAQD